MSQAAGKRDQRITIQQRGSGKDLLGQASGSWAELVTVWAGAKPLRGREFFAAGATQSEATVTFSMLYRDDITSRMRVLWRGTPYDIVAEPIDVDGGRHTLELLCATGVKDGR